MLETMALPKSLVETFVAPSIWRSRSYVTFFCLMVAAMARSIASAAARSALCGLRPAVCGLRSAV
jgi:hypothetical protein